jgi:general secretion pathway protein D
VTIEQAIKSISRISGLWYRYDEDTRTYRLLTREEYGEDLVVRDSQNIEIFKLLNVNVQIVAKAIEDLYGNRVSLSLGLSAGQSQTNGSGGNQSRNGVRNSRSATGQNNRARTSGTASTGNLVNAGGQLDVDDLSQRQIESLAAGLTGQQTLDSESVQAITAQSQPVYVTVNNEHNMIVVRTDDQAVIKAIKSLISEMDLPVPQVMLEMRILNVILGEDFNSIFNFQVTPSGSNQSTRNSLLGNNNLIGNGSFIYEFLNSRLQANIEFLERNNRIKILSNPMVLASNHREAELFIGEETVLTRGFTYTPPVVTNNTVVTPGFVEAEVDVEEIGITLRITPRINSDQTVLLELEQENSTINPGGGSLPITDGAGNIIDFPVDTVDNARLTGTVMAKDGLTVAVGGLIRTSKTRDERKVPLLGEIPVLGRAFRSTVETEEETETVLLITPHILERAEDSEKLRAKNNQFYKTHNAGYPDTALPENKFIKGPGATQSKSYLSEVTPSQSQPTATDRQSLYLEMSQYAAEMVRVPEIERVKHPLYEPVFRLTGSQPNVLKNLDMKTRVLGSWQRGGMYVTAMSVKNTGSQQQLVDYQSMGGEWLAVSVEHEQLQSGHVTYMYLISAFPPEQNLAQGR